LNRFKADDHVQNINGAATLSNSGNVCSYIINLF